MIDYIKTYDVKWLMLDLSTIVSPYVPDVARTGCHAKNHQHKDLAESYYLNYKNLTIYILIAPSSFGGACILSIMR